MTRNWWRKDDRLANYYLSCYHEEQLQAAFPDLPRWIGGSFWMRRKSLPELSI